MEHQPYFSTIEQLEEFRTSPLWRDILREIASWRSDVIEVLIDAHDMNEVSKCQGRIEAIDEFLSVVDRLIHLIQGDQ